MLNYVYRAAVRKVNEETGLSLSTELYEYTKHSFGTQYVNSGVDRAIIKDWFGHTDMKTKEKYAKFKVVDSMRKFVGLKGVNQGVTKFKMSLYNLLMLKGKWRRERDLNPIFYSGDGVFKPFLC